MLKAEAQPVEVIRTTMQYENRRLVVAKLGLKQHSSFIASHILPRFQGCQANLEADKGRGINSPTAGQYPLLSFQGSERRLKWSPDDGMG